MRTEKLEINPSTFRRSIESRSKDLYSLTPSPKVEYSKKGEGIKIETPAEIREKMKDPGYLPSIAEIKKAFNNLRDREAWNKFCSGVEFEPESEL